MRQRRNWPATPVRWPVLGKLLTVLTVASIVTTALFLSGCAISRKGRVPALTEREEMLSENVSASQFRRDSVSELLEVRTEPLKVPMSSVTLTIATDSLRRLPSGASYAERSGQANLKVSRKAATEQAPEYIYVYASCDSIELQCERYERQIRDLHSQYGDRVNEMQGCFRSTSYEPEDVKENPPNAIGTALKWYLYGLLSGIIVTIIIFIKLKK